MTRPNDSIRALHIVSEVAPFCRTSGVGDVAGALPRALARAGVRPIVVTPRYRHIDAREHALARRLSPLRVPLGAGVEQVTIYEGTLIGGVVPCWFLEHPFFDREGLYGDANGDYPDNGLRFGLLCRAALELAHRLDLWPDVVHAHDWQAGLALLMARKGMVAGRPIPKTVMTVHDLAHQGLTEKTLLPALGLGWDSFHPEGVEFYGQVSMLKAGLAYADRITAVSPHYAREIQTAEHGHRLDGFLRARADRIVGILNGIDAEVWNPAKDPHLPAHYDARDRAGKASCKAALQREVGLPPRAGIPLIASISRVNEQKGFDLVKAAGEELARLDAQYVFLAVGDKKYQDALLELQRRYPTKVATRIGHDTTGDAKRRDPSDPACGRDEPLAHRIEAGADLFLMPSRFEPCGQSQMHSLRYGTIPIVRATGGLEDTVIDYDERTHTGNGFKFSESTANALAATVKRAVTTYRHRDSWADLVSRAMLSDHSWIASGRRYAGLYHQLVHGVRARVGVAHVA